MTKDKMISLTCKGIIQSQPDDYYIQNWLLCMNVSYSLVVVD